MINYESHSTINHAEFFAEMFTTLRTLDSYWIVHGLRGQSVKFPQHFIQIDNLISTWFRTCVRASNICSRSGPSQCLENCDTPRTMSLLDTIVPVVADNTYNGHPAVIWYVRTKYKLNLCYKNHRYNWFQDSVACHSLQHLEEPHTLAEIWWWSTVHREDTSWYGKFLHFSLKHNFKRSKLCCNIYDFNHINVREQFIELKDGPDSAVWQESRRHHHLHVCPVGGRSTCGMPHVHSDLVEVQLSHPFHVPDDILRMGI